MFYIILTLGLVFAPSGFNPVHIRTQELPPISPPSEQKMKRLFELVNPPDSASLASAEISLVTQDLGGHSHPGTAGLCLRRCLYNSFCLGRRVNSWSLHPVNMVSFCMASVGDALAERFMYADLTRGLRTVLSNLVETAVVLHESAAHYERMLLEMKRRSNSRDEMERASVGLETIRFDNQWMEAKALFVKNINLAVLDVLDEVLLRFDLRLLDYSPSAREHIYSANDAVNRVREWEIDLLGFLGESDQPYAEWEALYKEGVFAIRAAAKASKASYSAMPTNRCASCLTCRGGPAVIQSNCHEAGQDIGDCLMKAGRCIWKTSCCCLPVPKSCVSDPMSSEDHPEPSS